MSMHGRGRSVAAAGTLVLAGLLCLSSEVTAQAPAPPAQGQARGQAGRGQAGPAQTAKAMAPTDFTGYWVAVITEDWRWRMLTPPKGDYSSVPLNAEGRRVADLWDPNATPAEGEQCRAFGAAGVMRLPTRLHITWEDDATLKVETDAGQQVRRFVFADRQAPAAGVAQWQGSSLARWERIRDGEMLSPTSRARALSGVDPNGLTGSLHVVTTRMRPGYLRKNGVPYSGNAVLTENFDRTSAPNGEWIVVTSRLDDPTYLNQPFTLSTHFRKEPDGAKWNPQPCGVDKPVR